MQSLKTARGSAERVAPTITTSTRTVVASTFLAVPRAQSPPLTPPPRCLPFLERLTIFDLDTLKPLGEISGIGGNGAAVESKVNHGFTSDHPEVPMFDTTTMTLLKSIDVGTAARQDGIDFDPFNEHVYAFSHPTKDATVIDAKDGTVRDSADLGGTPSRV